MATGQPEVSAPAEQRDSVAETGNDRGHPWRSAVLLGLAFTALNMTYSFVVRPAFEGTLGLVWHVPGDVWHIMLASHYVVGGVIPMIYEAGVGVSFEGANQFATIQYTAGPLLPILLAPVAGLGEIIPLWESYPAWNPRPTMWLVYGPYATLLSSIPFLYAVRVLATRLNPRLRPVTVQMTAALLVLVPGVVVFGHFDDVLTVSFLTLCATAILDRRWQRAAIMLAIAIGFKQWAVLVAPIVLAAVPAERRFRVGAIALLIPGGFYVIALITDWKFASRALLSPITFPRYGRPALWVPESAQTASAGPGRVIIVAVAVAIAWRYWNRVNAHVLLAAFSVTLITRLLFEPVVYSYYAIPGIAFLTAAAWSRSGSVLRCWTTWGSALLLLWFTVSPWRSLWWAGTIGIVAALVAPEIRTLLRSRRDDVPIPEGVR